MSHFKRQLWNINQWKLPFYFYLIISSGVRGRAVCTASDFSVKGGVCRDFMRSSLYCFRAGLICSLSGSRSSAGTRPRGRDVLFVAFLIEKTPKSEPPPSPTEHGSLTFLGSQEAPRCCPPNVFHQGTGTLIYSVVRKNWRLSNSLSYPYSSRQPPSPPLLLLALSFSSSSLTQQYCASV